MARPLFTPKKDPVPIVQETAWVPGQVWTGAENLAPTGIRSPDRPARSHSLYRLRFPTQTSTVAEVKHTFLRTDLQYRPNSYTGQEDQIFALMRIYAVYMRSHRRFGSTNLSNFQESIGREIILKEETDKLSRNFGT
jgi:hypothetical protein